MPSPSARAATRPESDRRVLVEPLEPRYLLSADLMPFSVAMDAGGDDFTLRLDAETDYLQLLDNAEASRLVAEQARGSTSEVRITGSDADDRLEIDLGEQFALATGIHFDAGLGSDALDIVGGLFDTVEHALGGLGTGLVDQTAGAQTNPVHYSGVEEFSDTSQAAERSVANESGSAQTLRLDDAGTSDDGLVTLDDGGTDGFTGLTVAAPSDSLVLQAGDAGDTIEIAGDDDAATATVAVEGGAGTDTLAGPDSDTDWRITGDGAGTLDDVDFSGIENLEGGAGADTFTVTDGGSLVGTLDGGAGGDTLAGPDSDSTWQITATDAGSLNGLAFTGIENLRGGAGADTFEFTGGSISGTVDGGGGDNTLDYSGTADGVTVDLAAAAASAAGRIESITGIVGSAGDDTLIGSDAGSSWIIDGSDRGTVDGVTYRDVENLQGGAGDDTFTFEIAGDVTGWLAGGLGLDTLFAADTSNTFTVDGENAGSLNGRAFLGIEQLEGGDADDSFLFAAGGLLTGSLAGGLGSDRIRGADQRNAWRLLGGGRGTFNGQGFSGIEEIAGGADEDTLVGPANDSTWTVSGVNAGDVAGVSFTGMENLEGAADNEDTFHLLSGGQATGGLEGGDAGFDSIVVEADGEATEFEPTGPDSGRITIGDRTTAYSGFEPVDALDSPSITITLGSDEGAGLTLVYDETDMGTDVFKLDGPAIEEHVLHIDDATDEVTIDLGDGDNDIAISGVHGTRLSDILDIVGGSGDDAITLGDGYGDLDIDAGTGGNDSILVNAGGTTTVTGSLIVNDDGGDVSTATTSGNFETITGDSIVLDVDALLNAVDRAFAEFNEVFAGLEATGNFLASLPLISGSNLGDVVEVSLGQMAALEEMLNDIRFGVTEKIDELLEAGDDTIGDLAAGIDAIDKTVGHFGAGVISTALDVEETLQSTFAAASALEAIGFRFELTLTPEGESPDTETITTTFADLDAITEGDPPTLDDLAAALNLAISATELGGQVAAVARDARIGFQVLSTEAEAFAVRSLDFEGINLGEGILGYPGAVGEALGLDNVKDRLTALGDLAFAFDNVDLGVVDDSTYLFSFRLAAERTSDFGFDFGADADLQGLEFEAAARLEAVLGAFFAADLTLDLGDLGNTGDDSFDADITELGAGFEIDAEVNAGANFGFLSTQATGDVVMDAGLKADSTPLSFSSGDDVGGFAFGVTFDVVGFDAASTSLTGDDGAMVSLDFEADAALVSGTVTLEIDTDSVFGNPDPMITFSGADVSAFADFNNLTASGVIRSLSDLASWLEDLTESELISGVDVPVLEGGLSRVADVASVVSNALLFDVGGDGAQDRDDKLANDLNNGLAAAGLDRYLRAVGTGDKVQLQVIDDNVTGVEIVDHTFNQLGIGSDPKSFSDILEITGTAFLGGVLPNDLRGTFRVTVNSSTVERELSVSKDALADNIGFGDDTPRLLDAFNSPRFNSATELAELLDDIDVLPDGVSGGLDYDETEDRLTYAISIVDEPVFATELGTDFEIDLAPVLDVASPSRLVLTGEGSIELVLGWDLSSDGDLPGNAAVLDATTELADLGIVAGDELKTDKAVTADTEPSSIRGVLTSDASFTLSVTDTGDTVTEAVVTVAEGDTLDNTTTADVASDIADAIGETALDGLVTVEVDGERLRFVEDGSTDLEEIVITVASGDPALRAFGLQPSQSAQSEGGGAELTARNEVPQLIGVLSGDATFEIDIDGTTYEVPVSAESTFSTDGGQVTGINRNIIDLATDVRNALREAERTSDSEEVDLTDRVEVGTQGSRLVLTLVDETATDMTVTPGTNAGELGLTSTSNANTNDLIVKLIDGSDSITEVPIDLDGAEDIQDVIDAFDDANAEAPLSGFTGTNLELGIVADDLATPEDESGKRLFVSYDDGTRQLFAIEATNGSGIAAALGIVGMDVNPFDPDSVADGVIEGSPIGGVTLADRFFLSAPGDGLSEIASFGFDAQAARLVTDIQVLEGKDEGDTTRTGIVGSVDFRDFVGETVTFRDVNGFGTGSFSIDDVVEIDTDGDDELDTFVAELSGGTLPDAGSGGGVALIETGINASASLGFIDVTLVGDAGLGVDLSFGLNTGSGAPAEDGTVTLAELLDVFDRDSSTELLDVVAPPKITFDSASDAFGGIDLTLGIADPDGTFGIASDLLSGISSPAVTLNLLALGDPFLKTKLEQAGGLAAEDAASFSVNGDFTNALAVGAKLRITPDGGDPVDVEIDSISHSGGTTTVDLVGVDGSSVPNLESAENLEDADIVLLPTVDAELPDFGALGEANFAEFGVEAILAALRELVDFLGQLEGFDLLGEPIPLLDRSVADIIAIGEDVAGFIDAFESDPAGSLQSVEAAINDAIGLSGDALSDIDDAAGDPLGGAVPGRPFALGYDPGDEMLTFEFTLGAFLAEQLPVGFDLGDALGDLDLGNLGTLSGSAGLEATGGVLLQLGLGIDFGDFVAAPENVADALYVLEDSTGLDAALSIGAQNLAFTAGLGPLALIIQNTESENAEVQLDLGMAVETTFTGRAPIVDVVDELGSHFELTHGSGRTNFGTAEGTLPVFFPNEGNHAGTIRIGEAVDMDFGDLANIDTPNLVTTASELSDASDSEFVIDISEIVGFLDDFEPADLDLFSNILLAVDSLDQFLGFLQGEIFGTLTTLNLPIVGESFADAATFIGDFREDFVGPLRAELDRIKDAADDFADPDKNVISQLLFDLLGPEGLDLLVELDDKPDDLTPGDSPEDFIGLDSDLLQDFLDGNATLAEALIAWDFTIGQELSPLDDVNIGFDLGIPGLGLETDGSLDVDLGWGLDLGFGISGADGFFFDVSADNELSFDFDVSVASGSSITGTLGFLALTGTNADRDLDGDAEDETTGLNASFGVDLFKDGDESAETIGFTELGSLDARFGVFAEAAVVLDLMLGLNSDIVGDTVATGLPSVQAGFNFLWQFDDGSGGPVTDPALFGDALGDSLEHISFNDAGINLGEFVSDVLKPVVDKVAEVTEPLQPIIDFLTAPVPIISEFGINLTMLDLAGAFGDVDPRMIESIADVITLINTIGGLPGGDLIIPLIGDGDLTTIEGEDLFLLFDAGGGAGLNPFGNDLTSDGNRTALNGLNSTDSLIIDFDKAKGSGDATATKRIVEGGGATFAFPFIEDPTQVFNLLLGQPMDLVTVDLQPLVVGFEYSQFFSVFGPLGVSINLVVEAMADFAFGMDTLGVEQFVASDFQNPALILNGLFVSDRENPDGTGEDVPELSFLGGAFAAAELNLGIARGGVAGGLFIEILFDLFDPDDDGKVRIAELVSNFENQLLAPDAGKALAPLAIFDVTGEIFARLFAFLKIDFGLVEIDKEFDIVDPITILDFEVDFFRPPTVASEQDNGDLTINIGPFAEQRMLGNTRDFGETVFVEKKSVSGDTMKVDIWTDAEGFGPDSPTESNPFEFEMKLGRRLVVDGGDGDDTIMLIGFSGDEVQFLIDGGRGDDHIEFKGTPDADGSGSFDGFNRLSGGGGSDTIIGSLGTDLIIGGAGSDNLTGDHGDGTGDDDLIFGDGHELLATVARGVIAGNDGDDVIHGADGNDILFGQGGRDEIHGDDDNDIVLGDGGEVAFKHDGKKVRGNVKAIWDGAVSGADDPDVANDDTLFGGMGDDWVFGGAGNDVIFDIGSDNVVIGGTGSDNIQTGGGFNIVFGDTGKILADYTAFIPSSGDSQEQQLSDLEEIAKLVAPGTGTGRDEISGGSDQDLVYGGGGNDTLIGNAGVDMLFGGAGADILRGGDDRDALFGEGQPDLLIGGTGDDRLDGGGGGDELRGGEGNDLLISTDGFDLILGDPADPAASAGDDTIKVFYQGGRTSSTIDIDAGDGSDVLAIFGTANPDEILLRADPGGSNAFIANINGERDVERVNYNDSVERIIVNGGLGDDFFAADDTAAEISIFGGLGEDRFQIGQLFRTARTVDAANIASPGDEIFTIETTRGFLSRGISEPMTISGGLGDDRFTVFHNAQVLQLNGDQGDDEFEVRAFALVGSTDVKRERTDLSGGAGADLVRYAVSAPVNIDGGDGLDTVTVIGTEFSDDFVVTEDGVFGAGINVNFVNIEVLRVDGAEGDDRFFIQSTDPGVVTELFGGLGSDTVFASGDTPPVVSNDLRGHSGIVAHEIESTDTDSVFHEQQVHGISANVADDEEAFAVLSVSDGSTIVTEGDSVGDSYQIVLTRRPEKDVEVTVGAPLPSESAREQRRYFFRVDSDDAIRSRPDSSTVTLEFTPSNWNVAQTVRVLADDMNQTDPGRLFTRNDVEPEDPEAFSFNDEAFEGPHTGIVTHTFKSRDTAAGGASDLASVANGDNPTVVIEEFGSFTTDELLGHRFKVTEGPGAAQTRYITGAVQVGGAGEMTLTLDRAYDDDKTPEAGASAYQLIVDDSLSGAVGDFTEHVAEEVFDDRTDFTVPGVGVDESLIGRELAIIAGPGSGQAALILDVDGDELILNRVFSTDPVAGESVFRIDGYDGLASQVVEVEINDNDTPSLVIDESQSRAGGGNVDDIDTVTAVIEGGDGDERGENDVVLFSLNKEPDSAVEVTVQFDSDQLTINGDDTGELIFDIAPGDWDEVQELVVSAADDILREGFHNSLIRFALSDGGDQTPSNTETIVVDPDTGGASVGLSFEPDAVTSVAIEGTDIGEIAELDFLVVSNKVIFIEASSGTDLSTAELAEVEGEVTVSYEYTEPGFENAFAEPVLVRIADDDAPTLLVRQTGGSTDVIETDGYSDDFVSPGPVFPAFALDSYELVLTGAPGDETVKVFLDELVTKTTKTGGLRHDEIQVDVSSLDSRFGTEDVDDGEGGTLTREFIEFTNGDWSDPATIGVVAVNDDFLDGGDTKVFAPGPASLSGILGPVIVDGAGGEGSLVGIPEPLMLPGETNVKPATGDIDTIDNPESGAVVTVNRSDLTGEVLHDLRIRIDPSDEPSAEPLAFDEEIEELVGKTLEITRAPAAPSTVDQFRQIIDFAIADNGTGSDLSDDQVTFTLNAAYDLADGESFDDFSDVPRDDEDDSLAADGEPLVNRYALTSESPNFFVDEDEQVDVMFVNDQDSPADSAGTLTADRLFGLGMGPDLVVGDREFRGGISYGNFEVLELNLGTGYNDFDVLGTPTRDDGFRTWTLLNTGIDVDDPNRTGERVGDTVEVFLNADDLVLDDGDTVSDATNPTSPHFQTRITLDGAEFADDALVGHVLELDQTVDGKTSTIVRSIISNADNMLVLDEPLPVDEAGDIDLGGLDGWRVVDRADGGFAVNAEGGDDLIDASASTLGIVAFGGAGQDEIIGGSGDDILFGDVGRVDYLNDDGAVVTRLGHAPEVITGKLQGPDFPEAGATTLDVVAFDPDLPNESGSIPLPSPDLSSASPSETADTGLTGLFVDINDGTGFRQEPRLITGNTEDRFTVATGFTQGFDETTRFRISTVPEDQTDGFVHDPGRILAVADAGGDDDTIHAGEGDDVVVGGEGGDEIVAGESDPQSASDDDIAFGDLGVIERAIDPTAPEAVEFGDPVPTLLTNVRSIERSIGGVDVISGNAGADLIVGGNAGDTVHGDDATASAADRDLADTIIGDNGEVVFDDGVLASLFTTDVVEITGGADTIEGNAGADTILGGVNGSADVLHGDAADPGMHDGDDLIVGDNGAIRFDVDADLSTLDEVVSLPYAPDGETVLGGGDIISGDAGNDTVVAGSGEDEVYGNDEAATADASDGDDILIGDHAVITHGGDVAGRLFTLGSAVRDIRTTDDEEASGGADLIEGNAGADVILGGVNNGGVDVLYGDAAAPGAADGADTILGDNGLLDFGSEGDLSTLDEVRTQAYASDGETVLGDGDVLSGNEDRDLLLGGTGADTVYGDNVGADGGMADGNDIALGDQGVVELTDNVIDHIVTTQRTDDNAGDPDVIIGAHGDDLLIGGSAGDLIDGGDAITAKADGDVNDDLIFGDQVELVRRADGVITDPRFQALHGQVIYDRTDLTAEQMGLADVPMELESGDPLNDGTARDYRNADGSRPAWAEWLIVDLDHDEGIEAAGGERFGDDYIAGGNDHDVIYAQLGDDVVQGDGSIESALAASPFGAQRTGGSDLVLTPSLTVPGPGALMVDESFDADDDGDDYIEGMGGDDVIFGNLGQDDIIGGSSSLYTLSAHAQRPDGSDLLFGGSGTEIDRNDDDLPADGTDMADRHARDADTIVGDNANIFRLVGVNRTEGAGETDVEFDGNFLAFNYDNYGSLKIIPRAVELLDYTPGGPDITAVEESGPDDVAINPVTGLRDRGTGDEIHGETGDDFIYGMVGADVLFGDADDDDLIGGYDDDWISGGTGQDGVIGDDGRIFTSRNGVTEPLNGVFTETVQAEISTPGNIQQATINITGDLKKAVDLTPFNLDPTISMQDPLFDPAFADDIIYGGLGRDFLHGGAGDDAISGAEALPDYFDAPVNPGNVLGFGDHTRAGEFRDYNEFEPLVRLDPFFLNFADGDEADADGNDAIFGALGNDWIVGGTDRDDLYGGYGNDLLDADDDKDTNGGANDAPDGPDATMEDRAYGGAGRDVLIANTGGDRLIDWAGEFNSYIVPFAPFGMATVSRTVQPQLPEFLYDLSASDGADPTRAADTFENAERNGEPDGELGVVTQRDDDWQAQTGAPADPQAGNIPGGPRDVLRGADFNNGSSSGFFADSGTWEVDGGNLQVSAESLGGDAVSVYHVDEYLPTYFEIEASISVQKPKKGWDGNSYVIFDYQGKEDFKFAGVDDKRNKMQLGHRTSEGWIVDTERPYNVRSGKIYDLLVAVNGTAVTVVLDNKRTLDHVFEARTDADGFAYGINSGMVGFGSDNSRGVLDDVRVQVLPPEVTLDRTEDFEDATAELELTAASGSWNQSGGVITGAPDAGVDRAVTEVDLGIDGLATASLLTLRATVNTDTGGGFVFDRYSADDFKFAAIDTVSDELVIGHHRPKTGWVIDARVDEGLKSGRDYELELSLKGTTVSVSVKKPGAPRTDAIVSHVFNAVTVDGGFGLLAKDGPATFDDLRVKTDDPAFADDDLLRAGSQGRDPGEAITGADIAPLADEAARRLGNRYDLDPGQRAALAATDFEVVDLTGLALGRLEGDTVWLDADAAGHGWFVDPTPGDDTEFRRRDGDGAAAVPTSPARGRMDLLTAVAHELGHVIGLDHDDAAAFMDDTLEAGMRLVPPVDADGTGKVVRSGGQETPARVFDEALGDFLDAEEARWLASLDAVSTSVYAGRGEVTDPFDVHDEDDPDEAAEPVLLVAEDEGEQEIGADPAERSNGRSPLTTRLSSLLIDWTGRFDDFRA